MAKVEYPVGTNGRLSSQDPNKFRTTVTAGCIESEDEIMVVAVQNFIRLESASQLIPAVLPSGLEIVSSTSICHAPQTPKIPAPMQRYGGSTYVAEECDPEALDLVTRFSHTISPILRCRNVIWQVLCRGEKLYRSATPDLNTSFPGLGFFPQLI